MKIYFATLVARDTQGQVIGVPVPVKGPYFDHGKCEAKIEEMSRDTEMLEQQKRIIAARIPVEFTLTTEMRCA